MKLIKMRSKDRGVETSSRLPDILTCFHHFSPACHIHVFCKCVYSFRHSLDLSDKSCMTG